MHDRRKEILDASLRIFLENGFSGTTISDIRKASGATTGSIYHFFSGKHGIAIALWRDAIALWSRQSETARETRSPKDMITSSVRGLLDWATEHRSQFLFFEELRIRAYTDPDLSPIVDDITRTHEAGASLYEAWVAQGHVKPMPWPVASALMVGPAYDYLRKCQDVTQHREAINMIVDNAWNAVRRTE